MRIAFLADIHSNFLALEAVVRDLGQTAPDAVYLVGDLVNRCPWPNEVMDLVQAAGWPGIYGNHDWVVGRLLTPDAPPPFDEQTRFSCLWWTAERLWPEHLARLRDLPAELRVETGKGPPLRLVHGVPGNCFVGVYGEMAEARAEALLAPVAEDVVVVAHTHRPLAQRFGRWQVFNPGSVGLPYNEDPRAQYMLLDEVQTRAGWEWRATFRRLDYDHEAVRVAFSASGMAQALGPTAQLHLLTVLSGHAYSSDYGYWLKQQPRQIQLDPEQAVPQYLAQHGPGRWAFTF